MSSDEGWFLIVRGREFNVTPIANMITRFLLWYQEKYPDPLDEDDEFL